MDDTEAVDMWLCTACGRADLTVRRIIRKRVYDLGKARRQLVTVMYVIPTGLCSVCNIKSIPHCDDMSGTSFGPTLRAHISTYRRGIPPPILRASEGDCDDNDY